MSLLIRQWITNLAIISILGVVMDLLLPNGNLKRYTRFLMGVILLTVMLKPILQIFNQVPNLEKYMMQNVMTMDLVHIDYQSQWIEDNQTEQIKDHFAKNLETHIENQVIKLKGYPQVKAKVDIMKKVEDGIDSMDIQKLQLEIGTNDNNEGIRHVDIGVSIDGLKPSQNFRTAEENHSDAQQIIQYLSNYYDISPDKIQIHYLP